MILSEALAAVNQNMPVSKNKFLRPHVFSDFLYELQVFSGLGVANHCYDNAGQVMTGDIVNYHPFYDSLNLGSIISFDDFIDIVNADREPSAELVNYIYQVLNSDEQTKVWAERLKRLSDVGEYCLDGGRNLFAEYLTRMLDDANAYDRKLRLYTLSEHLRVFPSHIEAVMAGKVIVSDFFRHRVYKYFSTDHSLQRFLESSYNDHIKALHDKDSDLAHVMEVIGSITKNSDVPSVLYQLFEGHDGYRRGVEELVDGDILDSILCDYRSPNGQRQLLRKTYPQEQVKGAARAISTRWQVRSVFLDLAVNRPLGQILEEYVLSGKRDWGGFIYRVCDEWNVTQRELSQLFGVHPDTIGEWIKLHREQEGRPVIPFATIERLSKQNKLNAFQSDLFFALSRGDLSFGVRFEDAVLDLISEMDAADSEQVPRLANRALEKLIKRSGRNIDSIVSESGVSQTFINQQILSDELPSNHAIPLMHKVARAIAPQDMSAEIVTRTGLLFLGITQYRSVDTLFDLVDRGELSAGDMVREYRLQLGMSMRDFGENVGGVAEESIRRCENAPQITADLPVLKAVADYMGLSDDCADIFVKRARGLPGIKEEELREVILAAVEGNKAFKDVIQYVVKAEFALRSRENSGLTDFASVLGVKPSDVHGWYHGKAYQTQATALKTADVINVPDDLRDHFVAVVMNRVMRYDPAVLQNADVGSVDARKKMFNAMVKQAGLSQKRLAEALGISASSVETTLKSGFWNIQKVTIEQVSMLLIPESHKEDRFVFCSVFTPSVNYVAILSKRTSGPRAVV